VSTIRVQRLPSDWASESSVSMTITNFPGATYGNQAGGCQGIVRRPALFSGMSGNADRKAFSERDRSLGLAALLQSPHGESDGFVRLRTCGSFDWHAARLTRHRFELLFELLARISYLNASTAKW